MQNSELCVKCIGTNRKAYMDNRYLCPLYGHMLSICVRTRAPFAERWAWKCVSLVSNLTVGLFLTQFPTKPRYTLQKSDNVPKTVPKCILMHLWPILTHSHKLFFQNEAKCKTFVVEIRFICIRIKNHFHVNGFELSLALKQRLGIGLLVLGENRAQLGHQC